jgi:hypothetical protein
MLMYSVLAYVLIFRIEELGPEKFRKISHLVEPSKLATLIDYIFNEANLWNIHRSSWMIVKDLSFVESFLLPPLLKVIPEMHELCNCLLFNAAANSQQEQAKKELQMKGEVGINKGLPKRKLTRPASPKLTKPSPSILPEPVRIEQHVKANEVPISIYKTNLSKINELRAREKRKAKEDTLQKYNDPKNVFQFHETSGGRSLEKLKEKVDSEIESQLQFSNSYYNPPPKVRSEDVKLAENMKPTAAAILREDFLYRKQQAKDAQILKNYEEDLRDPFEYYLWQESMEKNDEIEKLKHVNLRRQQAKQASGESKMALERQKADNLAVGNMIRDQNEVIKLQKRVESEIETLSKQSIVRDVIQERETKPSEAVEKVIEQRKVESEKLRFELEALRSQKQQEDALEEIIKADRIRQLKALNTVHRKHVVVFDPTETAKVGLLDEMSYMEMKERLEKQKVTEAEEVALKNEAIRLEKEKKESRFHGKYESILKNRLLKRSSRMEMRQQKKELELLKEQKLALCVNEQNLIWEDELRRKNELKSMEKQRLMDEQEKIVRQQQYLGVAQEQIAFLREKEIALARERQERQFLSEVAKQSHGQQTIQHKELRNKVVVYRRTVLEEEIFDKEKEKEIRFEKKQLVDKMKDAVVYKKEMYHKGQRQHEITKKVQAETNAYAVSMSNKLRATASQSH